MSTTPINVDSARAALLARFTTDDDIYPSDDMLEAIAAWPMECGFPELLAALKPLWAYSGCGYWTEKEGEYHISTGGWSGNESIIGALERNYVFWAVWWKQSRRGGHYIFGRN